ncbi:MULTISPECIES: GDSL-type esterase/lipase family protein [Zobellia]|uniref:GDSL-type esterase/lipase family protein n=1 Tax=Zobellia TaxID=112040 RepID=UPI000B538882|nr:MULTISPECIES: GDSL-type esterase/lipase family protein [Zobellia]MBU3025168.1 G-D-S-L family lipolytic protein [Zobellia galactanivorans]OWW25245.1 G-D-S-L family lipolytic protein [Zobellia sp. OII3]
MKTSLIIFLLASFSLHAQSAFNKEVKAIVQKYDSLYDASQESIVFTGSSSIRVWKDLQERFPEHQIINSGFGGSQAIDLLQFTDELILRYHPKKVFIYEGDNDIQNKKKPKDIIRTITAIKDSIFKENPQTEIVFISAKPSLARWKLRRKYKRLNRKMEKMTYTDGRLLYVDVWNPMLDGRKVKQDIFVEDGLHMNPKGYEIWYSVLKDYLN